MPTINEFSTPVLVGVVEALPQPPAHLLDTYFPNEFVSDQESISFDVANRTSRITPLVSPLVAGRVVDRAGYTTKTITPAYAKDKRRFGALEPFRRAIGERIGQALSPAERRDAAIRRSMEDALDMLTRR